MFLDYYRNCFNEVCVPSSLDRREFGGLLFEERIMVRHRQFRTADDLKDFLCSLIPSDVYYSSAYYEQPDAQEMGMKGWAGADLVFDIDADHLNTPCQKAHDEWTCTKCGFVGRGIAPEKCPVCGGEKFGENTWVCEACLATAKEETVKLLDIMTQDFGFSEKELRVFFSGHRGYHIHVESEAVRTLDAVARKEIVDYVCGLGFDVNFRISSEKDHATSHVLRSLSLNNFALGQRIRKRVHDFIRDATQEDYKAIGLNKNIAETILTNKDSLLKNWENAESWVAVKGMGFETWKKIIESCARSQSAQVDTVVTTDTHRLIRLAGTLHGKTGLKKVELSPSTIEDFDPLESAIAFRRGSVTVSVSDAPVFRLGDETFGPYNHCKVTLPTAAAVLLLCRGRAEVVEESV
jgi:DNA primase small subunit